MDYLAGNCHYIAEMIKDYRLPHIDAMRGFLMLLVVMEHSSTHLFATFDSSTGVHTYMVYIVQFMMPAFFFVCGYVLYRPHLTWSRNEIRKLLKKKINSQIVSPVLFFLLYIYVSHISLSDGLFEYHKEGYWFTFTLFFFYLIFSMVNLILDTIRTKPLYKDVTFGLIGVGLFYSAHILCSFDSLKDYTSLFGVFHWRYFIFMFLGYLTREYKLLEVNKKHTQLVCGVCIVMYIALNVFYNKIDGAHWILAILNLLLLGMAGTIIVYCFFSKYWETMSKNAVGKGLLYLGQRTLCVYYVNFLLLPVQLQYCTRFLVDYPMPLVEMILSLLLAVSNILLCLIIYNVIFLCPALGEFLFGKQAPNIENIESSK